jgi:hypothetical protein
MFAWLTLPCVEDVEGNLLVSWFLVATKKWGRRATSHPKNLLNPMNPQETSKILRVYQT